MSDTPEQARNDLRAELTRELAQLEHDVYFARQRKLSILAADLSRIRTRIGTLLAALDRAENRELRRNDYAPRVAV